MTPDRSTRAATRRATPAKKVPRSTVAGKAPSASLDLVCCRVSDGRLTVLRSVSAPAKGLPWTALAAAGAASLDIAGARLGRKVLGRDPRWVGQLGAFNDGPHPSGAPLSVAYLAVVPVGTDAPAGMAWVAAAAPGGVTARQRAMIEAALGALRERMDVAPIAFRMLPDVFTLSDLQEVYELLLGRRLHKASFRRALAGAHLVAPTDEWHSEGRGRPAQLFRYAPRKRKRASGSLRRPVRFELLG